MTPLKTRDSLKKPLLKSLAKKTMENLTNALLFNGFLALLKYQC
jgi:hypothetical protein